MREVTQKVLSIAGSSSLGSAGIQADLKTFQECGVFGMGVVTALVTNSPHKGRQVFPQPLPAIEAQCETAFAQDGIDAMKTGMLYSKEHIQYAAQLIGAHRVNRVVVDPVMVAKSGAELQQEEAAQAMRHDLLPLATITTPNVPEAIQLSSLPKIETVEDMKRAAKEIYSLGSKYVLVKGGRLPQREAIDVLYDGETWTTFACERMEANTNGAGCTFSAAIAAELAKGASVHDAVKTAKAYITTSIRRSLTFADSSQRINHAAHREAEAGVLLEEPVAVTILQE